MPDDAEIVPAVPAERRAFPSTSAERMARSRERRRKGLRCVNIEIYEREIDALVRRGRLSPDDRGNLGAIRQALYGFLNNNLR